MDNLPVEFGIRMGRLVAEYRAAFAWLAPLPHLAILGLLFFAFRRGQAARRAFAVYHALVYAWLFAWVGIWFCARICGELGPAALAMYGATPVLLAVILCLWIGELRRPRLDLDLLHAPRWRYVVAVPAFLWAYWYPPYEWGVGLDWDVRELIFGAYGLMGCPVTMAALAVLFLKYPSGNRRLFQALTAYAVLIGAAMTALRYVPDVPFFGMGLASLVLIVATRLRECRTNVTPVS